jgi:hypothetical protein
MRVLRAVPCRFLEEALLGQREKRRAGLEVSGYFKIHRSLLDHPYWYRGQFSKGQAMIDLVGHARWKDGWCDVAGRRIDLKRGQLCWSVKQLSERWGWSYNKVKRFLNELKADNFLDYQNVTVTTLISITNFDQYQADGRPNVRPNERTGESQKNNVKNSNNNYSVLFEDFWKLYPPRNGVKTKKAEAWKSWQKHGCEQEADKIMLGVKSLIQTDEWQREKGRFIPMATTLLNQRAWEIEVAKQSNFIDDLLDINRQAILNEILTELYPEQMVHFDQYCNGCKPIPPKIKSEIEERYHAR